MEEENPTARVKNRTNIIIPTAKPAVYGIAPPPKRVAEEKVENATDKKQKRTSLEPASAQKQQTAIPNITLVEAVNTNQEQQQTSGRKREANTEPAGSKVQSN